MKQRSSSALMVIASAVLWGLYGSMATVLLNMGMERNALTLLRFLVTAGSIGLLILLRDPKQFRIKNRDLPLFIANGLLSLLFFIYCYTASIRLTKVATAAALLSTAPAIVMVLSAILFKERMTPLKILCCILAVAGCAFASGLAGDLAASAAASSSAAASGGAASGAASSLSAAGILFGLGAGLGYALYTIFSRMILNRGYSVYTNIFFSFSIGLAGQLVLSCADGSAVQLAESPVRLVLGILCMILTGPLAYGLYTTGMQGMENSRAAQLAAIEPATAAVLGSFLLRQPLSLWEGLGIGMILLSVVLSGKG